MAGDEPGTSRDEPGTRRAGDEPGTSRDESGTSRDEPRRDEPRRVGDKPRRAETSRDESGTSRDEPLYRQKLTESFNAAPSHREGPPAASPPETSIITFPLIEDLSVL